MAKEEQKGKTSKVDLGRTTSKPPKPLKPKSSKTKK